MRLSLTALFVTLSAAGMLLAVNFANNTTSADFNARWAIGSVDADGKASASAEARNP